MVLGRQTTGLEEALKLPTALCLLPLPLPQEGGGGALALLGAAARLLAGLALLTSLVVLSFLSHCLVLSNTTRRRLGSFQSKVLWLAVGAPRFVRNTQVRRELGVDSLEGHLKELTRNYFAELPMATVDFALGIPFRIFPSPNRVLTSDPPVIQIVSCLGLLTMSGNLLAFIPWQLYHRSDWARFSSLLLSLQHSLASPVTFRFSCLPEVLVGVYLASSRIRWLDSANELARLASYWLFFVFAFSWQRSLTILATHLRELRLQLHSPSVAFVVDSKLDLILINFERLYLAAKLCNRLFSLHLLLMTAVIFFHETIDLYSFHSAVVHRAGFPSYLASCSYVLFEFYGTYLLISPSATLFKEVLLMMACSFLISTANIYFLYQSLLLGENPWSSILRVGWAVVFLALAHFLVSTCVGIARQAKEFNNVLYQLMIDDKTNIIANNKKLRLHIAMKREIVFTACGFFKLDFTLLHSMIAAATTYVVILIQFGGSDPVPSRELVSTTPPLQVNSTQPIPSFLIDF